MVCQLLQANLSYLAAKSVHKLGSTVMIDNPNFQIFKLFS